MAVVPGPMGTSEVRAQERPALIPRIPPSAPPGLADYMRKRFPAARMVSVRPMGADSNGNGTRKVLGYGEPLRIDLQYNDGRRRSVVLHMCRADDYGHDRRADRAGNQLLAYDTFRRIPGHVRALDVGAIIDGDTLQSLARSSELYLLTSYAPGTLYAEDLRKLTTRGKATEQDLRRCDTLARYLVDLHGRRGAWQAPAYRRAIRDLLGHGEGIFGIVDGFPDDVPSAPAGRLRCIEERCLSWRWRLRNRASHLTTTHGDFHPFNLVFDDDHRLHVLDASRGGRGDAADDVTCLAINYIFFALDAPGSWAEGLGVLYRKLWATYLDGGGDQGVLEAAAPYLAWRGLVLANPRWYPHLTPGSRDRLLRLIERTLDARAFDPAWAETLFP